MNVTQPLTPPDVSVIWGNIVGDIEMLSEQASAYVRDLQTIQARLLATIDADLGLLRIEDTEQVRDFIASAASELQGELESAQRVIDALVRASESTSAAVQLLEVHKKTRHIAKKTTAKKLRESRPLLTLALPNDSAISAPASE